MKFPNALAGVKKIFTAEILSLIATFCGIMTVVFMYFLSKSGVAVGDEVVITSEGAAVTSFGGMAVFGMAAAVLAIIAFIFRIIGSKKASVDEPGFKVVFYLILGGIAVALIGGIVTSFVNNNTVSNIFSVISDVINLAITVFIIQGICNLAVKLGDDDMNKKGNNIFKIIIAMYVLIIIARIVTLIAGGNNAGNIIAGVFGIIAGILSIVQYILYLIFLSKAKKMLAE